MTRAVVFILFIGVCFLCTASALQATTRADPPNLFALLSSINATRFATLINTTGLAPMLTDRTKNTTVFVPTNEAIEQATFLLNATTDQVKQVLLYHLTLGVYLYKEFTNGLLLPSQLELSTLSGEPQQLKFFVATRFNETLSVRVNNARITAYDFHASNGVAHLLSSVIIPPPLVSNVTNTTTILSTLFEAIEASRLQDVVNGDNVTVLAPVNDGFPAALTGYLLLANSSDLLKGVLEYHVVPKGVYYANRIPSGKNTLPTDNANNMLTVENYGDNNITINGVAKVLTTDVLAANGVVHLISSLLLPPGFKFNLNNALQGLNDTILLKQLVRGGLDWLLVNGTTNTSYTIFAPTNAAFQSSDSGIDGYSLNQLLGLLKAHIVNGNVRELLPNMQLTNLNGDVLVVGSDGKSINLKDSDNDTVANIIGTVNVADNGNVYSIDKVLRVDDDSIPEMVVIIVLVTCVPALLLLLGIILLWDLRNWLKKRQSVGYSPISGDDYEQS